ncbi:MAG: cysteine desulfurase [Planctomycetota bacterium]|jgi:cysteine desulfurase
MAIYLDHNASSPMHPEVVEAILPFLQNPTGNPSSLHSYGRMARSAVESARAEVAALLGCESRSVIFTSGGSEANNFLLKGFVSKADAGVIVSSTIEHPSVLEPLIQLSQSGEEVIYLNCDSNGVIDLEQAKIVLQEQPVKLLSVISANNETGVIQPVEALAEMVKPGTCLVHSDATQVVGKLPINLAESNIDALSFSAHKLRGPQGIGALVISRKPGQALISGGEQERKSRAGTENVAMIVGMGKAAQLARVDMDKKAVHLAQLRNLFEAKLTAIAGTVVFGQQAPRLPNTSYFALPYYHGETLLMELDRAGFALSSGSACHSEVTQPSHVLSAMGVDEQLALNAIRVSFGAENSMRDVDMLIDKLKQLVNQLPAIMRQAAV